VEEEQKVEESDGKDPLGSFGCDKAIESVVEESVAPASAESTKDSEPKKVVKDYGKFWDDYANRWDKWKEAEHKDLQHLGDEWGAIDPMAKKLIDQYVRAGMRVLEIGSGGGRYTELLLAAAGDWNVEVADVSSQMLSRIESRFGDRVKRHHTDGSSLDAVEPEKPYDVIFTFDALVHVDLYDILKMVLRMKKILIHGGPCILHHSNVESTFGFEHWIAMRKFLDGGNQAGTFSVNSPRIMRNALRYFGFQIVAQEPVRAGRDAITVFKW
jgi:2-polyprenyl-3-methyl-5-hydroxy-6-metoxy-1,4-benzoquinol methylase